MPRLSKRCLTGQCPFLCHSDDAFAGHCCRCCWEFDVGTRRKQHHGKYCQRKFHRLSVQESASALRTGIVGVGSQTRNRQLIKDEEATDVKQESTDEVTLGQGEYVGVSDVRVAQSAAQESAAKRARRGGYGQGQLREEAVAEPRRAKREQWQSRDVPREE